MNKATSLQDSFSIQRHAVQQLLRQALDSAPQTVCGLLGGRGHNVEAVLALHNNVETGAIRDAIQSWQDKGIRLLAAYASEDASAGDAIDSGRQTAMFHSLLPNEFSDIVPGLPLLIIRTDTKGRIEAKLLAPVANGQVHACPLEMQEDGGLYPLGNKG